MAVLTHLFKVCLHRFPRLLGVAPLHGLKNPLVMKLAALRATWNPEDSQALLPQQANDRIDQGKDQRVRRRLRQRQVKIQVCLDVGVGVLSGPVHHRHRLAHSREIRFLGASGREGRDFRLQDGTHLGQVSRTFRLTNFRHQVEGLANGMRGTISDEGSAPGIRFH